MASEDMDVSEGCAAPTIDQWVAMLRRAITGKSFGTFVKDEPAFQEAFNYDFLETSEEVYREVFSRMTLEERFLLFYIFVCDGEYKINSKIIHYLGNSCEAIRLTRPKDLEWVYLAYIDSAYEWHSANNFAADNFNWALHGLGRQLTPGECSELLKRTPVKDWLNNPHERFDALVEELKRISGSFSPPASLSAPLSAPASDLAPGHLYPSAPGHLSSPLTLRVVTRISGTDPHKECYVTLSTRSKKALVVEIYERLLEDALDRDQAGDLEAEDLFIRPYYQARLKAWQEWDEKTAPPVLEVRPTTREFTGYYGQEIVAVDHLSSYCFHYIIEDRVWDTTKDFQIIINEH